MSKCNGLCLVFLLFLTACGGGEAESETQSTPLVVNSSPVINSSYSIVNSTSHNSLERGDNLLLLLTITDKDGDFVTGSASLADIKVNSEKYSGNLSFTHQFSFVAPVAGNYDISVIASDSKGASVNMKIGVSINSNTEDVVTTLKEQINGFIAGGNYEGSELLGIATDVKKSNIGYMITPVNEQHLAHNGSPYGTCGTRTPHKLISVQKSSLGPIIPTSGLVFPLECLTSSQSNALQAKFIKSNVASKVTTSVIKPSYIAQNITVTFETTVNGTSVTTTSIGAGFTLEGNMSDVTCGNYSLFRTNNNYLLEPNKLVADIDTLFKDDTTFNLECHRTVEFEGVIEKSPLVGRVTGSKILIDSFNPTGTIDDITFSAPFGSDGLDVGNICVSTTIEDNSGDVSESLVLISTDQLSDNINFDVKTNEGKYCLNLDGVEGHFHVAQTILDASGNSTKNSSRSFQIVKNQAPVFSSYIQNQVSFDKDQGVLKLVDISDVSDPEGHKVTLTGDTHFDTNLTPGNYTLKVFATDQYNAQSSKEIMVTLNDHPLPPPPLPPEPPQTIPVAVAGNDQEIMTSTTVLLDGSGSYDDDGDLLTYIWEIDSKPTTSFVSLNNATTATPSIKVDKAGEYQISLVVNDGKDSSKPSSLKLTVVEGVNPIPTDINLIINAGHKYHGFSTNTYQEVLQSLNTDCWYVGALDIDKNKILYSVSTEQSGSIKTVDPSQPLCIKQGPQPSEMHGLAIDTNGDIWGTSTLINEVNQRTKLYHLKSNGNVISEVDFSGHEDVIFGIDFSSDGTLYGVSFTSQQLVTININTGETTFVATLSPSINVHDIDIDKNDVLRILNDSTGDLFEYDLSGNLLRQTNLPTICVSCGWVSIATND